MTSANRIDKIKDWLEQCKRIKSHYPFTFHYNESALLILDMQNYFLDPNSHAYVPSSEAIISPIQKIITKFVTNHRPIFFSRHIASSEENEIMNLWWRDRISAADIRSQITKSFTIELSQVITKTKYSAFQNTPLEELLQQQKIKQLVICGIMTHLCCESTIRDAFMRNYQVFCVVDGTATYTEQLHLGSLRALSHGFAKCVSTEEIFNGE